MSKRVAGGLLGLLLVVAGCGSGDEAVDATTTTAVPGVSTTIASTTTTTTEPIETPVTTAPATAATTAATATTSTTIVPPTSTTPADTTASPSTTEPASSVGVRIYLLRGERLAIAHRDVAAPAILRGALEQVLAGPTAEEASAGLHSAIPAGSSLRDLNLVAGVATVDLSRRFESGGGTMSMSARLAQVVFTATQFENVDEVVFWLDGEPVEFFGGEGIVLDEPQARIDVDRALTGDILIAAPAPGETVTSPFVVTGEGDVFEGDFPLAVTRDGEQLGELINVFAGAYGDWRGFEVDVTVDAPPGPIELVATSGQGCTPDVEPNCQIFETVVPLVLAD